MQAYSPIVITITIPSTPSPQVLVIYSRPPANVHATRTTEMNPRTTGMVTSRSSTLLKNTLLSTSI